jgi:hypothetical protein
MSPESETDIPLLPVHGTIIPEENSQTMGANVPRLSTFKLTDITVNIPSSKRRPLVSEVAINEEQPAPSRWATLEFKAYYVIALIVIPIMAWIPISLSSGKNSDFLVYNG